VSSVCCHYPKSKSAFPLLLLPRYCPPNLRLLVRGGVRGADAVGCCGWIAAPDAGAGGLGANQVK
tara:strand:+ start:1205 stop:1399 length:195 start_codon:yes stop_codon:yes gene_type:complete